MATIATTIDPDITLTFDLNPGTLLQFLQSRADRSGPRLKCFEGSVTLVSPGRSHEFHLERLTSLILAICLELRIKHSSLRSTTWFLPLGFGDTAYEADAAYQIPSQGRATDDQPPDLAIEIVVSHQATKTLRAGAFLKIPEMWVLDVPRSRLTFHHLVTRGKNKGTYRPEPRSRAFPILTPADILERLDDPDTKTLAYLENCRTWAREVLVPRLLGGNEGG